MSFLDQFDRAEEIPLGSPYTHVSGYLILTDSQERVQVGSDSHGPSHIVTLDPGVAKLDGGDGWIELDVVWPTVMGNEPTGIVARVGGLFELVALYMNPSTGLELREVNGSTAILDTFATTFSAGVPYTIRLELNGANLEGFLGGTSRVSGIQGTPTAHEDAGFGSVNWGTFGALEDRVAMDNFRIGDPAGPGVGFSGRGS